MKTHIAQFSTDRNAAAAVKTRRARNHKPTRILRDIFGESLPPSRAQAAKTLQAHQHLQLQKTVSKLVVQGAWSQLERTLETDRKWKSLVWSLPATVTQFASKAALDVLPTRANLCRWKVACDSACRKCHVKETLHHVLNHCDALLNAGLYKWRHDSVLQHIAESIPTHRWKQVSIDLPGHAYAIPFPTDSAWRPDIVLLDNANHVHIVELTIPFERNIHTAHDRKSTKYAALVTNAKDAGFIPSLHCVEMGSRGIPGRSWIDWATSPKFNFSQTFTNQCAEIAIRASHVIWTQKDGSWTNPPLLRINNVQRGIVAKEKICQNYLHQAE